MQSTLRQRSFAGFRLANRWTISALVIGLFLALPLLVVASHLLLPGGQAWDHLAATVLPGYIATTLVLLVMVLAGVVVIGVTSTWLVAASDFH